MQMADDGLLVQAGETRVPDGRAAAAELVGTALLVFIGCGTILSVGEDTIDGKLWVAFAHGFAIAALVYATAALRCVARGVAASHGQASRWPGITCCFCSCPSCHFGRR